jgi:hypothetical protein
VAASYNAVREGVWEVSELRSFFGKKRKSSKSESDGDSISDAAVGDVFTVTDLSIEYEDSYFVIEKLNRYKSDWGEWYEILGVDGDKRLWVYWSGPRGVNVSIMMDERPVGLATLGIDEETLAQMDEAQSIDSVIEIDGEAYYYSNSAEAFLYEDNTGKGRGFYVWDFASEDGNDMLSIDKWEGVPFQGHFVESVAPESVSLYKR